MNMTRTFDIPLAQQAAVRGVICQTRRLSKALSRRRVLDGVDLTVCAGERIALTGANGAGKTTLLRCLAGAVRPTQGEVQWFAPEPAGASETAAPRPLRHRSQCRLLIGMVAHQTRLYRDLTAWENVVFAARMWGLAAVPMRARTWLERCGLSGHAHRQVHELSRGMQQRVAVARALIHEPQLVLLDEPFTGLDQEGADWLCRLLRDMSGQERAIVFATHEPRWVTALATRELVLERGRLRQDVHQTRSRAA